MAAKLAVIIVTYNSASTIERCLASLERALLGMEASVVVVDNASRDKTVKTIESCGLRIADLRVIRNEHNVGFAKAVNQGIEGVKDEGRRMKDEESPDVILLLNPDTEVEGDVIARTIEWMAAHPKVGVAGPVLLNSDGTFQPSVRRFPTFWVIVGMAFKLQKVFPNLPMFRKYFAEDIASVCARSLDPLRLASSEASAARDDAESVALRLGSGNNRDEAQSVQVDQVMGAVFFVNAKCWRELGGMDERFFLWFEEVDFCKRATAAGWDVVWLPFRAIRHIGGVSFAQRPMVCNQRQFFFSAAKYFLKHRVAPPFWFDRKAFWIAVPLTVLFELLSFWGHEVPTVGAIGLVIIALFVLVFGLRDPVWPVAMIMAELAVGSKGYGLVLPLVGGAVSIRMVLFAVAVAVGSLWTLKTRARAVRYFVDQKRTLAFSWLGLIFFIFWAALRGVMLGHPAGIFFFDMSPWLFILLLPSFLIGIASPRQLQIVVSVMLGSATVFTLKTLFLLYVFTHDYGLFFLPTLYHWVRDTGNAEVTQLGENFWRIFAQSHLYTIIALVLWLSLGRRLGALAFFSGALAIATVLISLSRSFWFGIVAALAFFFVLPVTRARLRALWKRATIFWVLSIGLCGTALLFAVVRFPIPSAPSSFSMSVFTQRVSSLSEEAAARSRWQLLPVLWHEVASGPFTGKGFGSTVRYQSADPRALAGSQRGLFESYRFEWGYLDVWLKMGLGGFLALVNLLFVLGRALISIMASGEDDFQRLAFGLFSGLVVMSFTHMTSPYLNHPLGIGYLLFVTSALSVVSSRMSTKAQTVRR